MDSPPKVKMRKRHAKDYRYDRRFDSKGFPTSTTFRSSQLLKDFLYAVEG